MKILLLSDSHNNLTYAREAIKRSQDELDLIIHCGDNIEDARSLEEEFSSFRFAYVSGNCDSHSFKEREKIIEIENQKILLTHGDKFGINYGYDRLFYYLESKEVDICICGHTHKIHFERSEKEDITIINPGSISLPRDENKPSYAVLNIEKGKIERVEFFRVNG